jgi:hypothetical protein
MDQPTLPADLVARVAVCAAPCTPPVWAAHQVSCRWCGEVPF